MELVPAWIEAIATALGFCAAGVAAYFAWKQWLHNREQYEKGLASGVSAWWMKKAGVNEWGVYVVNATDRPYYAVRIYTTGNKLAGNKPITFGVLPPAPYYVRSNPGGPSSSAWSVPQLFTDMNAEMEHVVNSEKHRIDRLEYVDGLGCEWRWTPADGLKKHKNDSSANQPRIHKSRRD